MINISKQADSVDELRFAPPQPPQALEGVQNASAYGPACPQSLQDDIEGGGSSTIDEDCKIPSKIFNFPTYSAGDLNAQFCQSTLSSLLIFPMIQNYRFSSYASYSGILYVYSLS